ncbi:MAG: universal stress protein [Chloroflexi bacterium]|nr:universal stress protein [Chloroflexota bacterium]MDA1146138.1 universal stress protein [Chloroflexota bacterium]
MRILIALTGHDIDEDIAAAAARMFGAAGNQIIAVHVAHPRDARSTYERLESTDTAARGADLSAMTSDRSLAGPTEGAEQAVARLQSEFADHVELLTSKYLAGFEVERHLVVNTSAADAIVDAVSSYSIDAVTMGSRGVARHRDRERDPSRDGPRYRRKTGYGRSNQRLTGARRGRHPRLATR